MSNDSEFIIDDKISENNEETASEWEFEAFRLFNSDRYEEARRNN